MGGVGGCEGDEIAVPLHYHRVLDAIVVFQSSNVCQSRARFTLHPLICAKQQKNINTCHVKEVYIIEKLSPIRVVYAC